MDGAELRILLVESTGGADNSFRFLAFSDMISKKATNLVE